MTTANAKDEWARQPPSRVNGTEVPRRLWPHTKQGFKRRWWLLVLPPLIFIPIFLGGRALLGFRTVSVTAELLDLAETGFPYHVYGEVLAEHVRDGRVDYAGLAERGDLLRRFGATLAEVGPRTDPARFPRSEDRLAYYINAYNALVLLGVVERWPVASVLEIHGRIEPTAGFGFFVALSFELDGETTSLYDLENRIRDDFPDARIHGALNCASQGCPRLASTPYLPDRLDEQLEAAARRLANAPHVRIDDTASEIVVSAIYRWYAQDFAADARRLGAGVEVVDWVRHFATPKLSEALAEALTRGYRVRYWYDWGLNGE